MNWLELVENPEMVREIYEIVPALKGIEVFNVILSQNDNTVTIGVNLPCFADKPPPQWLQRGYNTIRIDMDVIGLEDIQIDGWSVYPLVDMDVIASDDGKLHVKIVSADTTIQVVAHSIRIARLVAYRQNPLPIHRKK